MVIPCISPSLYSKKMVHCEHWFCKAFRNLALRSAFSLAVTRRIMVLTVFREIPRRWAICLAFRLSCQYMVTTSYRFHAASPMAWRIVVFVISDFTHDGRFLRLSAGL